MNDIVKKLLIVEDDPGLQKQMCWCFDESIEVFTADNAEKAISILRRSEPQVMTLDLGLPPDPGGATVGFEILEQVLELAPRTKVIVVTGREETEHAVKAIGMGAYDYYQKPVDSDLLTFVVARAFRLAALEAENRSLLEHKPAALSGLIACSEAMLHLCKTVEKIAPTDLTALLIGETGTGKEVLARALHEQGGRAQDRFYAINCAAIPENLLESELFGYEKGAFTGAAKQKIGKIEAADGGTLFLDEIGDMPLPLQAKLLRFLQERQIERVGGGPDPIPVNVRVVCATHRDLKTMIAEASFREDLFYRISEITLQVPPLRDREGDALLLANQFLETYSQEYKRKLLGFSDDAIAAIESYRWPGNVRELVNKVKRATIMAEQSKVSAEDLEIDVSETSESLPLNLKEVRERAEKQAILRALNHSQKNVAQAARILGITRPTLYNLLSKYNMEPE